MFETGTLFYELALVLLIAIAVGGVARVLHQPLIVAFVVVGIIVGPTWLNIISHDEGTWELLATTGVALLLFLVGLKLDVSLIRKRRDGSYVHHGEEPSGGGILNTGRAIH